MGFAKQIEHGIKQISSGVIRELLSQQDHKPTVRNKRILLMRYGHIGDMILSLPVFRTIRSNLPNAKIDVLCDPANISPVLDSGYVDHIYVYDKLPLNTMKLVRKLRHKKYDYIGNLIAHPSFTFGLLARLIGPHAIRSAGEQGEYGYLYNRLIDLPPKSDIHMLQRLFLLAADLTANRAVSAEKPWVEYPESIKQKARQLLYHVRSHLPANAARIAGINLTAGLARREWPLGKNIEFLSTAIKKYSDQIDAWVVFNDPYKSERSERVRRAVNSPALLVLPQINDFRVMMEFIKYIYILVTPDTAFAHAASAMGSAVVDLMIAENVTTWAPIGVPHTIVSSKDPQNLEDLSVVAVLRGLEKLLGILKTAEQ
jgi:ADP-heptose:LPS heptosyltransferase